MKLLLAVGMLCCSIVPEVLADEPMNWEDCVRETSQRNPDLVAAHAALRKAKAQYLGSYSAFLPQVSANLSMDQGTSKTHAGASSRLDNNTASLSAQEELFAGFRNTAQVQQQRAALDAAEAALTQVKAQVGLELKSAFAQLLFAQEQVALAEHIARRREDNARMIALRYQAGSEHEGSYLKSRAAAEQAQFDVAQAKRTLGVSQQQLAKVVGKPNGRALSVDGMLQVAPLGDPPDFERLALETPMHRQAAAEVQGAKAGVTIARSEFFPTIAATGLLSRQGSDWPLRNNEWLAGIAVSLPIFTGGRNVFDVRSATSDLERLEATRKSVEQQVKLALTQAFAALHDAVEHVAVQRDFLHAAQVRDEIATSQYAAGLLSFQNWDLIEDDLISNQKAMLTSQRDAVIADAAWEQVQGKSVLP